MTISKRKQKNFARWSDGPLVIAGNWEELIFRRRVGAQTAETEEHYLREHSGAAMERLRELGVNLVITHFFKGFGLRAEAPDIRHATDLVRHAHARGMRVGAYVGDTICYETFLAEQPAARGWIQRTAEGVPITYGGTQSFRWKWCRTNPAFLRYMQRVLRRAVAAGFDMIHFDNYLDKPEPLTCHCRHCAGAFRKFLRRKYTGQERVERLGFANCNHILPPTFSAPLYPAWNAETITNPLLQEWIDFRCRVVADTYAALARYGRSFKKDLVIECNPTGIWGENSAYMRSVDHTRLLPHGDFFWDESPNQHGLRKSGALVTHVRSMKMGEALGNRCFFYQTSEVKCAEALAFNRGCLGTIVYAGEVGELDALASWTGDAIHVSEVSLRYARFLNEHGEFYRGTRSLARVAVYRNFESLAFNSHEPHLQSILLEQTLLQNHIPFDYAFDLDRLRWPVLALAGMECLAEEEIARIVRFVEHGGGVVLVGSCGRFDRWRREYSRWPFAQWLMGAKTARVGRGWMLAFPELALPRGAPSQADREIRDSFYAVVDGKFWMLPGNGARLVAEMRKASCQPLAPLESRADRNTLIEPRLSADGRTVLIHLVNYGGVGKRRDVSLTLPGDWPVTALCQHIPGIKAAHLSFQRHDGGLRCAVPNSMVYSLVVAELRSPLT